MDGVYTMSQLCAAYDRKWAPFWRCPITGLDTRSQPRPALAIGHCHGHPVTFQMYATTDLADQHANRYVECARGMTAAWILDHLLHLGSKTWMDRARFLEVMTELAWQFGDHSWAFCCGSGNPHIPGRAA